jgi:hypothetical protein
LPSSWPRARLAALAVGAHTLTLELRPDGLDVHHTAGPEPLDLRYRLPAPGVTLDHSLAYGSPPELLIDQEACWLRILLAQGQRISVQATADRVYVQAPDRREEQPSDGAETPAAVGDGVTR